MGVQEQFRQLTGSTRTVQTANWEYKNSSDS